MLRAIQEILLSEVDLGRAMHPGDGLRQLARLIGVIQTMDQDDRFREIAARYKPVRVFTPPEGFTVVDIYSPGDDIAADIETSGGA